MKKILGLWLILIALLLTACQGALTPTAALVPTAVPANAEVTATLAPTAEPAGDTSELAIYDDAVASGWTLGNSWGATVDVAATAVLHGGQRAVAVTPTEDYGGLFFTVDSVSGTGYRRSRFLGVRFWLNPGDQALASNDLAVALTGSDDYIYWSRETSSAPQDKTPFTSESPLYELGVTGEIPANEWVKVELWFQLPEGQSAYRYITGLYIKNTAGFRNTFYVDDVALVALRDAVPPTIIEASSLNLDTVVVQFSEDVDSGAATNVGNYAVDGKSPIAASYDDIQHQATLTLGERLESGVTYTLTVSKVTDLGAPPNAVAEGTKVTFVASALPVTVDAAADVHWISPYIYGLSGPPREYMEELHNTLNNWGGNASTRYNWKLGNAWNAARDWYYQNGSYDYVGSSASDDFLSINAELGIASLLTIPTIGWVAKDTTSCSFPQPDGSCGDASGASCDKPGELADPTQTSVEAPPEYMVEWIEHLDEELGIVPQFLAMDNEPDIWGATHYDIHPQCTTYDEIYERFVTYAAPIKEAAPASEILGPVSCCWWYYWNSMAGEADREAHDNMELLPWFLSEMKDYEVRHGQRLLDVLDVHYYPAGLYSDDISPEVSALRTRSTRSLWDPTYVDESWIGEPVYLVPRMLDLIDTYYPCTRFGIGEWNWGAEETFNGAVTIADVLGIYGREKVYFASYWRYPDLHSPGFFAFKMYTNYDGEGARFGDTSVQAVSGDWDTVGSYAALDSATGNLHLMLVNKHPDQTASIQVELANFGPKPTATQYRYDSADAQAIVASMAAVGETFDMELPPYSITLLVIEPVAP